MAPTSPDAALSDLLLSLFSAEELRRFLRYGPDGERLLNSLPAGIASPAQLADEAVLALRRAGGLDDAFFDRLVDARERRRVDIDRVRARVHTSEGETAGRAAIVGVQGRDTSSVGPAGGGEAIGGGLAPALAIDDVLVRAGRSSVDLDVRVRNVGRTPVNLTRARLRILHRVAMAAAYTPSASYDLLLDGELNETPIAHVLGPGEVDAFILRVGATPYNTSCHFQATVVLTFNGRQTAESEPFSFETIWHGGI